MNHSMNQELDPFFKSCGGIEAYQEETFQEKEMEWMRSCLSKKVLEVQELAEKECALLDYEGSRIYDQYPDKHMMNLLCKKIEKKMAGKKQVSAMGGDFLEELIQAVLFQEISRRRCRRKRCRGWH